MFDPGTKIIILDSSHQKTIGPKKGSIGYVANCLDTRIFSLAGDNSDNISVVSNFCEVFFIRYGFEEKNRIERRIVISVIPILKRDHNNRNELNPTRLIKLLHDKITSQKDLSQCNNLKECYNVPLNTPIVLAAPMCYDRTNLLTCDEFEFRAWINSYASSSQIEKFINNTLLSGYFSKYKDPDLNSIYMWEDFRTVVMDKTYRSNYIKICNNNIENRKACISVIRKLAASQLKTIVRRIIESNKEVQIVGMYDFPSIIYGTIMPFLYNKAIFNSFINMCYKWEVNEVTIIVKDIEAIVSECLLLSNNMTT